MIKFQNVSKKYTSDSSGVFDINFEIADNEFVFLVGPSGAGKTTLLKLILRELLPDSGEILIEDQIISGKNFPSTDILRRSIGMIFQDCRVLPDRNVFENIALALQIADVSDSVIRDEVHKALHQVSLSDKAFFFPRQLSAGELQRVTIARSIIGNRHIILADEPTGNLDPKTSAEIMQIFAALEGKKTLLIATHNSEIVSTMKKRVITVKDGRIFRDKKFSSYDL